jgi:hypothetical protein
MNELRNIAARSGALDIGNVEIDVILTYLLQLFTDKGIMCQIASKATLFASNNHPLCGREFDLRPWFYEAG